MSRPDDRRLRLVFASEYYWPEIGGLERSTERLARHLVGLGHRVHVVTRRLPNTASREVRGRVTIHRYSDDSGPFTAQGAADGLFADADVVCLFGVGHDPLGGWWHPVLDSDLRPGGVRLLKVGTDGDIPRRRIPAEYFAQLDGVLCQTRQIAEDARAAGVDPERCFEIRNGLSVGLWRSGLMTRDKARRKLDLPSAAYVVLGLGRFTRRKRFPDLVAAFDQYRSSVSSQPVLVLHGSDFGQDDGEEKQLRGQAAAMDADIRFLEPSVDPAVSLVACDVMATLAEREGAPNIFIEAFATGRPVLASQLPGHSFYVRHNREGLLAPVDDISTAAEHLGYLGERPNLREGMGRTAWHTAAHFDIGSTARDYLHAFNAARFREEPLP